MTETTDISKNHHANTSLQQLSSSSLVHGKTETVPLSVSLQLPSPIVTRRTRTASTSARALKNPIVTGVVKSFNRMKGHGFIAPHSGGEDIFCHVSDIEGEYIPMPGDDVKYRLCAIPPKNEKFQAVHVQIIHFSPEVHHRWEE